MILLWPLLLVGAGVLVWKSRQRGLGRKGRPWFVAWVFAGALFVCSFLTGSSIGVFLFPVIQDSMGTAGALKLSAGFALIGILLTLLIPETAQRSLEDVSGEDEIIAEAERIVTGAERTSAADNL